VSSRRLLIFIGFLVLFLAAPSYGAAPKKPGPTGEVPLLITAARLEADQNSGTVTFSGKVKATYGDAILYADRLVVYLQKQPAPASRAAPASPAQAAASPLGDLGAEKIDRIVAKGNVRLVQQDRVATGQEAIYYKNRDEVVLLGNPQLWRAENTLKGERIIYNLKTNKVLVESSPQRRVEALLYSKGAPAGKVGRPPGPGGPKARQP
jgi:lipopolysaccharide export system protein LptA